MKELVFTHILSFSCKILTREGAQLSVIKVWIHWSGLAGKKTTTLYMISGKVNLKTYSSERKISKLFGCLLF
jgi:hypothetical protein